MLWIALHLPQLPLDAVLRSLPEADVQLLTETPLIVCEQKTVGWCNAAAVTAGIRQGMSEGNARALSASLQTRMRDLPSEQQALHEAALWALHFTPHVTLQANGLMAEIAASLRLFGGRQRIVMRLLDGLQSLGLHADAAYANTASAAWLQAKTGWPASETTKTDAANLDKLPLAMLEQAQPHLDTLHGIGCNTIGQLRLLPRKGVVRRFGQALLSQCDRAYGEEPEVHAWFVAPPVFDARIELAARVEHTESLLFAARRLLLQLAGWLAARHTAAHALQLFLHHEPSRRRNHRHTVLHITLGMASRDPEHLTLLLRERLAQLVLDAPVIELSLKVEQMSEQAAPNTELFPTPANSAESLARLIERLQSRLGNEAVRRLAISADHRPERSVQRTTIQNAEQINSRRACKTAALPLSAGMRPTWLLPIPLPLKTHQHKPYYQTPLTLLTGPERIEAGWWDDALATRDYFIAESERHVLYWIFRTRIDTASPGSGWFLHGLFG